MGLKLKNTYFVVAFTLAVALSSAAVAVTLTSPTGKVSVNIYASGGNLYYIPYKDGKPALDTSALGIKINGYNLGAGVTSISATTPVEINRTYAYRGVKTTAVDHCNEFTITIYRTGSGDQSYQMVFRAYDDGIAYRYKIPGTGTRTVNGEVSNWVIPSGTCCWYQTDTKMYEDTYDGAYVDNFYAFIGMPVTLKFPGGNYATGYGLINESALFDYSGMSLRKNLGSRVFQGIFQDDNYDPWNDDYCSFSAQGGQYTPWRVTVMVDDLNQLVNSTLIANLAPPPSAELATATWIKPGKCLWSWWAHSDDIRTNPYRQYDYIDAAAAMGFDSVLFDDGWKDWSDSVENDLYFYAKNKGVDVWLWKKCGELWSESLTEQFLDYIDGKNIMLGEKVIVGIKVDFMNSESANAIWFYEMVLQKAAEHQIMVNFHGANKPAGESITYPNELTREGVRGLEYNKFGSAIDPSHNCILPFTRMVAGHADYTPCSLKPAGASGVNSGYTTWCHQLATATTFTSPVTHWAEDPYYYLNSPARDYIEACPPVWDETVVMPHSEIGKLSVFARRSGDKWFLAVMNGERSVGKNVSIPLSFLADGVEYQAVIYTDSPSNAYSLNRDMRLVTNTQNIDAWIAGGNIPYPFSADYGGGLVAMFSPVLSINDIKDYEDGTSVSLTNKVVTAMFHNYLYIEETNRTSGIRVATLQTGFAPGDVINVQGTMNTYKVNGYPAERIIVASTNGITKVGTTSQIKPLYMNGKSLGGSDVEGGCGLGTVGLLVTTTGKITAISGEIMYIDDGSGIIDPAGNTGVAIRYTSTNIPYSVGDVVSVTGIEEGSILSGETKNRRYIRVRYATDVIKRN